MLQTNRLPKIQLIKSLTSQELPAKSPVKLVDLERPVVSSQTNGIACKKSSWVELKGQRCRNLKPVLK
jgi:hypothetical protein